MTIKQFDEQMGQLSDSIEDDAEVVVVMTGDTTQTYSMQGVRWNKDQKTLEVLVG